MEKYCFISLVGVSSLSPFCPLFGNKLLFSEMGELTECFTFVFPSNSAGEIISYMYCIPQVSCTNECISSHAAVNAAQGFTCPVLALSKSSMSMHEHLNEPWAERCSTFFNQEYHLRQHGNWSLTKFILLFSAGFNHSICTKSHSGFLTAL